MTDLTRRDLIAATAAVGTVGLAGCLGGRDGEVPKPIVTDDRIDDGWRLIDRSSGTVFEDEFGPVTVRALEHTTVYERADVAEAVAETINAEGSPVLFFATRIDLRPGLDRIPFGIGRDQLMEQVRAIADQTFREQLRQQGLEDVRRTDEREMEVATGHQATEYTYRASFPIATSVALLGEITGSVEMEGRVAVWHDGTDVLIAGGAYPVERLTDAIDDALPEDAPAAEELVEDDTLAVDPDLFAEDVGALIMAVE